LIKKLDEDVQKGRHIIVVITTIKDYQTKLWKGNDGRSANPKYPFQI
jgi:hypothetical protein